MTEPVKIGWKKLRTILNDVIIKNLNLQKPLKGDGISLSQTASGTIISTIQRGDDTSGGKSTGSNISAGSWTPVDVMDANCNRSTIWVWASSTNPGA
jgi:hypothetical protein